MESEYACSICWDNSATISASRSGGTWSCPNRCRTKALQSRMVEPREQVQRGDELPPGMPLFGQRFAARRRQTVIAAPPLSGLLHPLSFDQLLALHSVEHGIQRRHVKL